MPNEVRISASLLKDYFECPRKVYFRIKGTPQIQTQEMLAGTIVHNIAGNFWANKTAALAAAKEYLDVAGLNRKNVETVYTCVENLFSNFSYLLGAQDLIEHDFKIRLASSYLVGKIDRIGVGNAGTKTYLVDWKTSRSPTEPNINRDIQFIIYSFAFNSIFLEKPSTVLRVNLFSGSITPFTENQDMTTDLISLVIPAVANKIRENILDLEPTGLFTGKCSRCVFSHICLKRES